MTISNVDKNAGIKITGPEQQDALVQAWRATQTPQKQKLSCAQYSRVRIDYHCNMTVCVMSKDENHASV